MLNVSAIILAAGSGSRIGTPKLKLKIDEEYFINVIIKKLSSAGVKSILAVIKEDYKEWCLGNVPGAFFITNKEPEKGMFHSVKLGILNSINSDGLFIFPVDHPFVKTDTISELISSFQINSSCIIKPDYQGKSGHPVIIPNCYFRKIISSNLSNLNDVMLSLCSDIVKVSVDDDSILKNVNNKSDL